MKVKDLLEFLKEIDQEMRIVIDYDEEDGWISLQEVEVVKYSEDGKFLNLIPGVGDYS